MQSPGNEVTKPRNVKAVAEPRPRISGAVQDENVSETIHYLHQPFNAAKSSFHSREIKDWLGEYRFRWQWLCVDCWRPSEWSDVWY